MGGAYDTHWCRDYSDIVCPGLSQKWHDHARWKLDPRFTKKTVDDLREAWENLERRRIVGPLGSEGWHHVLAHYRHARAGEAAKHIWGGRCQSGKRWFWYTSTYSYDEESQHCDDPVCSKGMTGHEYGWADTEDDAVAAYADASVRLGGMDPRLCRTPGPPGRASAAAAALKLINTAKRTQRPPKTSAAEAASVEYLYQPYSWDSDYGETRKGISEIPIVKKTAKRIYYDKSDRWDKRDGVVTLGYIDREEFETDTRCRDTCSRDIPAGIVCAPHGRDFPHCVHFGGQDYRDPRHYSPRGCGETCPVDTPGMACAVHGVTWDHCPHRHAPGSCYEGKASGQISEPGGRWYTTGGDFYATREAAEEYLYRWERERERRLAEQGPELKRLRMAMADAHPDRGGTNEGFIAARKAYERAMRQAS
jgi:hypothetical protein